MLKIPSLHLNSEYSLLESTIKIDRLIDFAKDNKLKELVLTDHNVMFGASEFYFKCKKNNIKPIVGVDLDVKDFRLILLSKNFKGYQHISKLSSKRVRGEEIQIEDLNNPNIFVIDHPTLGYFAKTGKQLSLDKYFIGTTMGKFENAVWVKETKILNESENKALMILDSIKNGGEMPKDVFKYTSYEAEVDSNNDSVKRAQEIIEECNLEFPEHPDILPKFKAPTNLSNSDYFKKIIQDGAQVLLKDKQNQTEYFKRIEYETEIIESLGFTDYFLIIWDMIAWAKEKGIAVGPGRGSSAGSLISYLLGITEVDPLEFGLLFERFLNPQRVSMPDIDIDIQDSRRDEVISYLFEKYGNDKVGLISTFQRLGAKMALRDCGRALKMPLRDVDALSKAIPQNENLSEAYKQSANFRALIDKTDLNTELFNMATSIEGLPRQQGTHAAGIVISNGDLTDKVPTINGLNQYNQVQYSMDNLELHGLLKIDLLGLRNLTTLKKIQEEIYNNWNKKVDLLKISYKDKLTNELLSSGNTNGIFQLESYGMKQTISKVKISSLEDVIAIISLYRPGPMDSIPIYSERKNNGASIEKIAPEYDKILEPTYGIIIYQEQIMQIAQSFAGMSFAEADILRRAISKKKISEIESLRKKFIDGALAKGNDHEIIEKVFNLIEKFANYGFNKSHAVAYSILAYRLAFLKARFPFEFYTAVINLSIGSQSSVQKYIKEAKSKKIKIIPPSINTSSEKVYNKDNQIILPLTMIKGFGEAANRKLLEEKQNGPFTDFFNFVSRSKVNGLGEGNLTTLIQAGTLREFGNVQTLLDSLPSALRYTNMISIKNKDGAIIIDEEIIAKPKLNIQGNDLMQEIGYEQKLFGFQLSAFQTEKFELDTKITDIANNEVKDVVFVINKKWVKKDKDGNAMAKLMVADSISSIQLTIFASLWKSVQDIKVGSIVKAKVRCKEFNGSLGYTLVEAWKEITDE